MPNTNKTLADFRSDLGRKIHGTTIARLQSFYGTAAEAMRRILERIDPAETKRNAELTLFDGIFEYASETDLKANKILDIRPQVNRTRKDNFSQKGNEEFDLYKEVKTGKPEFSVEWDDGTKFLKVSKELSGNVLIHDMDSTTATGTWSATGGASNLTADEIFYTQGSASLNFDIGSTGGYIENSNFTAVDLGDHDEISSIFVRVYIPDSSIITNFSLRWGSSSSAYWSRTVTQGHIGAFKNGWQWLKFDWNGATETGTVDPDNIDYLRLTIVSTSSDTDLRADEIRSILPNIHEALFYSKFGFRSSGGTWLETPTTDSDLINLDTEAYNILLYEAAMVVAQELQGTDASFDITFFDKELNGDGRKQGMYQLYTNDQPSEKIKRRSSYYRVR